MDDSEANNSNLALIIPQYTYDPHSAQLVQQSNSNSNNSIVNQVSFKNGTCLVDDGDSKEIVEFSNPNDHSEISSKVHFLGNANSFASLSTLLYQDKAISCMIHYEGNSIIVGNEMDESILSSEQQQIVLSSHQNTQSFWLTDKPPLLLENSNNEDYYITRPSNKVRRALYNLNLHLHSIHSSTPIIVNEEGKEKKPCILAITDYPSSEEKEEPSKASFEHIVVWSTNNHYCILETNHPVFQSDDHPVTSVHVHNVNDEFTEKEVIEMYLNNKITSSQQVLIYNIENHSPKYVTIVQTEDIPQLPTFSSKQPGKVVDVNALNHNIQVLMDFLANSCTEQGTYWLYKREGEKEMRLINISEFIGMEDEGDLNLSQEERDEKLINWKSMTAQLCCHYASILVNDFEYNDSVNHTQQYLLIHGISLYNDILSLCPHNMRLKHHYSNLLLDLYEKLGDSHIAYCYQTNTVNQQQPFPSHSDSKTILSHVYSALDCYYTASTIVTEEMDRLSVTGSTPRTLLSRLQHYNQILISVAGKIQLYLHHVIVFSIQNKVFTDVLRDLNTYLRCYHYYSNIVKNEQETMLFLSNMILSVYLHATSSDDPPSSWTLREEWHELIKQFNDFIAFRGKELYFIQHDSCFDLLILSISFLKPSSMHYGSLLNEMGRYTQSHYQKQTLSGSFRKDLLFNSATNCYQQAIQIFEKGNDYVNSSVIVCNLCQLIHYPLNSIDYDLKVSECKWLYSTLHWINERIDLILRSDCIETSKHTVVHEFADCQVLLIQRLFSIEAKQTGFITKVMDSMERVENVLDYCMNVYEMVHDEKKTVSVKYLLIQYYILSQQTHKLPDLQTIKDYVYEVFCYAKDKDIRESVNAIIWMCQLLILYSNQDTLTFSQRLSILQEGIPQILYCSPLFVGTHYDCKLDIFNQLKKQYQSIIMQVIKLVSNESNVVNKDAALKRCRRCIKIFNNDDFYYFFANVEEESLYIFQLLL